MMNIEKGDFVALDCCPICKKGIGIVINKTLKNRFKEKNVCTSFYVCDDCLKSLKERDHVILYESTGIDPKEGPQLTGQYADISLKRFNLSTFNENQKKYIEEHRIIFCDEEFFKKVKEAMDNGKKD